MTIRLFDVSREDEILVLSPRRDVSSLVEDHVQAELAAVLDELRDGGARHVVVDCSRVEYFGSIMLEAMRHVWTRVRTVGGKMAICGLHERAAEVLHISRFDTIWPVCAAREDAIQAVQTTPPDATAGPPPT